MFQLVYRLMSFNFFVLVEVETRLFHVCDFGGAVQPDSLDI